MRLVIDMQGAQSASSRNRGIGRYSLALAKAMIRENKRHDVWLAINAAFPDSIESIRAEFNNLLPQNRIVVWETCTPTSEDNPANAWRQHAARALRDAFFEKIRPDWVHTTSLFEGFIDDAVTSESCFLGRGRTAITLFDLIPLIKNDVYLNDVAIRRWYFSKLNSLRRADLWFAISDSSRREGIDFLDLPGDRVINVSTAANEYFQRIVVDDYEKARVRNLYGLDRPFVMYTGGIDFRKNIDGLIRAFAMLPDAIRASRQLAIICSVSHDDRTTLERLAEISGLSSGTLVITGFVPDAELRTLYNICELFCFPSLHEGFGLPALEAMQCGAAVIGSNVSSIPEVIGRNDALFDPKSPSDIARLMHRALSDDAFRATLKEHAPKQARKFSWQQSANRVWAALDALEEGNLADRRSTCAKPQKQRPRLAFVSPLPPERTGIADYCAELLPQLARHYEVTAITPQQNISDPWVEANIPLRSPAWFDQNAYSFERILYQFGNSTFHAHMFALLERHPGVVVLHDFYLGHIVAHLDSSNPAYLSRALYSTHGYLAVRDRFHEVDLSHVIERYPVNYGVIAHAFGVISHSRYTQALAAKLFPQQDLDAWAVIPLLRDVERQVDRVQAKSSLGVDDGSLLVCSFGHIQELKQPEKILEAWTAAASRRGDLRLVFVGEAQHNEFNECLRETITKSELADRIRITGYASAQEYKLWLAAADCVVQLRKTSRGETSRAILDAMGAGKAAIVNANGAFAELPDNCLVKLPDDFTQAELNAALWDLLADSSKRNELGLRAREHVMRIHSPRLNADMYYMAIEEFSSKTSGSIRTRLIESVNAIKPPSCDEHDWLSFASAADCNLPIAHAQKQLFVDVSTLAEVDARTGIQRVVRSMLKALFDHPPAGFRVEPVRADVASKCFYYARKFTLGLFDCPPDQLEDAPIQFADGDVFLGLDLHHQAAMFMPEVFNKLRSHGVKVTFVVYDLLPIVARQFFAKPIQEAHAAWLANIAICSDGLACISRAVADEVCEWLDAHGASRPRPLEIGWFHLGFDIANSFPTTGLPNHWRKTIETLNARPTFLIVSTIEPRKGQGQTLEAFDLLWKEEVEANLVLVGKKGWEVDQLVAQLQSHPESGKRLFWFEGISDEYLEKIYASSSCLIVASEGEGFALPVIEAAQNDVALLVRDIPVLREVAGDNATYFSSASAVTLATSIKAVLALIRDGKHPSSANIRRLTWSESAIQLKMFLAGDNTYRHWIRTSIPRSDREGRPSASR